MGILLMLVSVVANTSYFGSSSKWYCYVLSGNRIKLLITLFLSLLKKVAKGRIARGFHVLL